MRIIDEFWEFRLTPDARRAVTGLVNGYHHGTEGREEIGQCRALRTLVVQ